MAEKISLKNKVALVRCADYSADKVYDSVSKSLQLIAGKKGLGAFVKKGDKVLLKVNLLQGKAPEFALTTHPSVVEAAIRLVNEAGGVAYVGDSPGAMVADSFAKSCEISGFSQVCKKRGAKLIELDEPYEAKMPLGRLMKSITLSKKLERFDVIINLPKLKTHSLAMYTGAVKNLYGCVPGKKKAYYHLIFQDAARFSRMLLDLSDIIKPQLTIMDAIVGMEGDGPAAGTPRNIGVVMASESPLALDAVAIDIIGYSWRDVQTIKLARKDGRDEAFLEKLDILGERVTDVAISDYKKPGKDLMFSTPPSLVGLARNLLTRKPVVDKQKCISCGNCMRACPNGAIKMSAKREGSDAKGGSHPVFDYRRCIRCYCCQEMCPEKAIWLKGTAFSRLFLKLLR